MAESLQERIAAGDYDRKQLENIYANAERLGEVEVAESETLFT